MMNMDMSVYRKHLVGTLCVLLLAAKVIGSFSGGAFANDSGAEDAKDSAWLNDKARVEQLIQEGRCDEYWDVLWPWAKNGNLEARAMLFFSMASLPHMDTIQAPGDAGDLVTRMHDITIFAVHLSDYKHESLRTYDRFIANLYLRAGFQDSPKGKEFLGCVEDMQATGCAEIAVANGLVPSFEEYAKKIDLFAANGMKSVCEKE